MKTELEALFDALPVSDHTRAAKAGLVPARPAPPSIANTEGPRAPRRFSRLRVRYCACNSRLPFRWCHGRVPGAPVHPKEPRR